MKRFKIGVGLRGIVKPHRWIKTDSRRTGVSIWEQTQFQWKCRRCETQSNFRRKKPKSPEFGDCQVAMVRQVMES